MRILVYSRRWDTYGGGERYAGKLAQVLSRFHDVDIAVFDHARWNKIIQSLRDRLDVDLGACRPIRVVANEKYVSCISSHYDVFINASHFSRVKGRAKYNIALVHFPTPKATRYREIARTILHLALGFVQGSKTTSELSLGITALAFGQSPAYAGYDLIITNSEYSRRWLKAWWNADASVVFPPARIFDESPKERLILSVGRFSKSGHSKKHDLLITVFKHLYHSGSAEGWRLALVGSTNSDYRDRKFVNQLLASASGYPIYFEFNVSGCRLGELLRRASIYWHAAGYGEEEGQHPENFEHFGISIVEAMSAGALPIVFKGGGPMEIVQHRIDGYLWSTRSELEEYTLEVMRAAADKQRRMRIAARARSKIFCDLMFEKAVSPLLKDIEKRVAMC